MIEIQDFSKRKHFDRKTICGSKRRYDLIEAAYIDLCEVDKKSDEHFDYTIYKCPVCGYWHYGRNNKNKVVNK